MILPSYSIVISFQDGSILASPMGWRIPTVDRLDGTVKMTRYKGRQSAKAVEHTEGDGAEMFKAVCKLGLEGMVSKRLTAPYRSGPSKSWIKVKNPNSPAATRAIDGF
jgi:hypothetical protein